MKKLFTLLAFIVTVITFAQAPQGFNYQATVRNSSGALITNQNVYFKFNIMLNSQTSIPIYTETHYVPTDDLGQVNLVIGTGTPTTGTFSAINWGTGNYYLGIELNTGSGYVAMGTTQLLSVPYALYSNTSGSTINDNGFNHYIGELYGGGIVVSVWKDNQGIEHGLIVSLTDIGTSQVWSNVTTTSIGITAQSTTEGQTNTIAIINQPGHNTSAAKLCDDYSAGGFNDWYLPAILEIQECYNAIFKINRLLGTSNGFSMGFYSPSDYWSSTEAINFGGVPNTPVLTFNNSLGSFQISTNTNKGNVDFQGNPGTPLLVRAVRRF